MFSWRVTTKDLIEIALLVWGVALGLLLIAMIVSHLPSGATLHFIFLFGAKWASLSVVPVFLMGVIGIMIQRRHRVDG